MFEGWFFDTRVLKQTFHSVPLVKFFDILKYSEETFEFVAILCIYFPITKILHLLVVPKTYLNRSCLLFLFLSFSHEICCHDIPNQSLQIEIVFLEGRGNHLVKVFLRKLIKPPQVSERVVLAKCEWKMAYLFKYKNGQEGPKEFIV